MIIYVSTWRHILHSWPNNGIVVNDNYDDGQLFCLARAELRPRGSRSCCRLKHYIIIQTMRSEIARQVIHFDLNQSACELFAIRERHLRDTRRTCVPLIINEESKSKSAYATIDIGMPKESTCFRVLFLYRYTYGRALLFRRATCEKKVSFSVYFKFSAYLWEVFLRSMGIENVFVPNRLSSVGFFYSDPREQMRSIHNSSALHTCAILFMRREPIPRFDFI